MSCHVRQGPETPEWAAGPHAQQRRKPLGPPPAPPAWPPAHLPLPVPSLPDRLPDPRGLILSLHPVLCLLPPPPTRPAQFTDGRYWIYSPRHRRLRAVTLSSSGTVSDHGRPPGSPAPPRAVGSREPQVLAVPLPLRRDLGKMSLWLRSAALARVGLCAAGIPWGRCLLPSEVGVTGPAGTQLGLWGPAWLWQGLHLTPSPWLPLPLVPTLPGQGRARCTVPTCSDLAADGFHGVSVP